MNKTIQGNLLSLAASGKFDVIVHGCNCFCMMGSGVAGQIRDRYPQAYLADLETVKGDRSKLGNFTYARVFDTKNEYHRHSFLIVNAYTQYNYGRKPGVVYTDIEAVKSVFEKIKAHFGNLKIGYPKIGAGLGQGKWEEIQPIINKALEGCDHTLVIYP
jgi:O-acetyl-ADP-ribose deacetylase (regulator of RNase III)